MDIQISPSILSADFANLEREIKRIANADWVHVDVMDGHFVPNLTIGLPVVKRLAEVSPIPLDVHLMIDDPDTWAPHYASIGAKSITFHLEASSAPIRLARELKTQGVRVGVALKPATPLVDIADFLDEFDMILIMTVEPGFGGQKFIEGCLPKIAEARRLIGSRDIRIQVDGGIELHTIGEVVKAGANVIVAGSAVYNSDDPAAQVKALRQAAREALNQPDSSGSAQPQNTGLSKPGNVDGNQPSSVNVGQPDSTSAGRPSNADENQPAYSTSAQPASGAGKTSSGN